MTEEVFALDTVPASAWLHKVTAQPVAYQGRAALRVELAPATVAAQDYVDSNTFVVVAVDFSDGQIEIDLLGKCQETAPPEAWGFIGVAFRIAPDCSTFEGAYLRPTNDRAEDPVRLQHAVQYFAYPDWKFDRLRREMPGRYEASAAIGPDEWLHIRLVVTGEQVQMYLDGLYSFRKGVMCYNRGRGNERKRRKSCASITPKRSRRVKKT